MRIKYEVIGNARAHIWFEDWIIVKADPILHWMLGWNVADVRAYCDCRAGSSMRQLGIEK